MVQVCCDKLQKVGKLTAEEIEVLAQCQDEVENKLGVRGKMSFVNSHRMLMNCYSSSTMCTEHM